MDTNKEMIKMLLEISSGVSRMAREREDLLSIVNEFVKKHHQAIGEDDLVTRAYCIVESLRRRGGANNA